VTPRELPTAADTIVAIATAAGSGAVGVIRISGPAAVAVASRVIRLRAGTRLSDVSPRVLYRGAVVDPETGAELDTGLIAKMIGPRSYTGEDVIEISCHGNPALLSAIVRLVVKQGARLAAPGEFTRRAYVNGRMDLVQAEAVAELIAARTERAAQLAGRQLAGGASRQIEEIRGRLVDVMAALEVALDFPDDGFGLPALDGVKTVEELADGVGRLIAGAVRGRTLQQGLTVMLAGAPNVGKSSVFNRLLGSDRAIVDAQPGTTRDLLDGVLDLVGVPVRIMDGAGMGVPRDPLDAEGMRRSERAASDSDLVLIVLDGSRPLSPAEHELLRTTGGRDRIVVANKDDLPRSTEIVFPPADLTCSALTGSGIASLVERLGRWVEGRVSADAEEGGLTASVRVIDLLRRAEVALRGDPVGGIGPPTEARLVDLREALELLDRALGIDVEDAVLDRIFSTFCVGK
jgi:tRNA modification GTPase